MGVFLHPRNYRHASRHGESRISRDGYWTKRKTLCASTSANPRIQKTRFLQCAQPLPPKVRISGLVVRLQLRKLPYRAVNVLHCPVCQMNPVGEEHGDVITKVGEVVNLMVYIDAHHVRSNARLVQECSRSL
jgi:hypothetical protein